MKYFIVPVVPGSTGIVTKEQEKYLKIIPVKQTLCKKKKGGGARREKPHW